MLRKAQISKWCGRIYNETCLDTMARLPDSFIDLAITSPPYNMNLRVQGGRYTKRSRTDPVARKYSLFDDAMPLEEYYAMHAEILAELLRVARLVFYNVGIVTGSKRSVFKMIGAFNEYLKEIIVWDKGHGEPAALSGVINRRSELILVFAQEGAITRQFPEAQFEGGMLSDVWEIKRERSTSEYNRAVFPQALVEHILLNFSKEGAVVYAPFMGTGTVGLVAKKLGRHWLGSEIIPEEVLLARERIGRG